MIQTFRRPLRRVLQVAAYSRDGGAADLGADEEAVCDKGDCESSRSDRSLATATHSPSWFRSSMAPRQHIVVLVPLFVTTTT